MDNYNNFIGKKVNVLVAFSDKLYEGGAIPSYYCGILKSVNDDSIFLTDVTKDRLNGLKRETISLNDILINKKYIILIEEL